MAEPEKPEAHVEPRRIEHGGEEQQAEDHDAGENGEPAEHGQIQGHKTSLSVDDRHDDDHDENDEADG